MSGTVHGRIEMVGVNIAQSGTRDIFASIVLFFDAVFTRIASHAGTTPTGSASTALPGLSGTANFSGENAWGVWRWDKPDGSRVYIHMTWSWSGSFNSGGAVPVGGGNQTFSVGIQFAQRSDNGNPWGGSTNNNGADTKTNPVWTAGGGGAVLCVYPRANGPSGSGAAALSFVGSMYATITTGWRLSCVKDDDALAIFWDNGGAGNYAYMCIFSRYTLHPSIAVPTHPLMCHACIIDMGISAANQIPAGQVWGTLTGVSTHEGGAVVVDTDGVRSFQTTCIGALNNATFEPNGYFSGYDFHDIWLVMNDATAPAKTGLFGKLDQSVIATIPNIPIHSSSTAKDRAVLGSGTLLHYKWVIRWDGVTTPGAGGTLAGVTF